MRRLTRSGVLAFLLVCSVCGIWVPAMGAETPDQRTLLLQRSTDISAAQKQPRRNAGPAPAVPAPRHHRGFADPSFGPNGKPYPVPEHLRGQCYIDEGYGRFSACNFFQ
jgi:hypothetical protein